MRVCILSDSHDHIALLDTAVAEAKAAGAEAVLHCGDLVAPSSLHGLDRHGLPVHVIHGNNSGDLFGLGRLAARPGSLIHYHGMDAGLSLGGRRVFLVHYPHYAQAMALTGDWDLVCCGHSHKVAIEQVRTVRGTTSFLVNPGTVGGVGGAPATFLLGDLNDMEFRLHEVVQAPARGSSRS